MPANQDRPYHPPAGSGELLARADALLPRLRAMADDIDAARRLPPPPRICWKTPVSFT